MRQSHYIVALLVLSSTSCSSSAPSTHGAQAPAIQISTPSTRSAGGASQDPKTFQAPGAPVDKDKCARKQMLWIPGGQVKLGREKGATRMDIAPHTVQLAPYCIDATEVTVERYRECVDAGQCVQPPSRGQCTWRFEDTGRHPANCVSWFEAKIYCEWRGKRLPTSDEWEHAARGTEGLLLPWTDAPPTPACVWRDHTVPRDTCEVMTHPSDKSPYGLYDVVGNVSEWVDTGYCMFGYCYSDKRVHRGGAWNDLALPVTRNYGSKAGDRLDTVGFRCGY